MDAKMESTRMQPYKYSLDLWMLNGDPKNPWLLYIKLSSVTQKKNQTVDFLRAIFSYYLRKCRVWGFLLTLERLMWETEYALQFPSKFGFTELVTCLNACDILQPYKYSLWIYGC
jgi:hypothetical protein